MSHKMRMGTVLLLLVILATMARQPAIGQGGNPDEGALREQVLSQASEVIITGLEVAGNWARGSLVKVQDGVIIAGEGTIFLGYWTGADWSVYLEGTPAFRRLLPAVPESLLSAPEKESLDYESANPEAPLEPQAVPSASGYRLPWPAGVSYYITRAWATGSCDHGSHAVDVSMPLGSVIVAARPGVVIAVEEDFTTCGCDSDLLSLRNYVYIRHEPDDGLYDHYVHIGPGQALVSVGDYVCQGQPIAYSNQIGYTCGSYGSCPSGTCQASGCNSTCTSPSSCRPFAHLHFHVENGSGQRQYITFDDVGAIVGCHSYTSGNAADTTPPTTNHTLAGTGGENGWYLSAVQVTLSSADGSGCGVQATQYRIDSGSWQTYASPFTVSGDGAHTAGYRSQDRAGNWESEKQAAVSIDATPPTNPTAADPHCAGNCSDPNFTWVGASDATSGVAGYYFYWGTDLGGSCTNWTTYPGYDPAPLAPNTYFLRVSTKDNAGNVSACETMYTLQVTFFRIYLPIVRRSTGGGPPPSPTATATPLPTATPVPTATPAPIIVDDGDPGFYSTDGWNPAANWTDCQGYSGDARWTLSRQPAYGDDHDYATWTPNLPQSGSYQVWVFFPRFFNDHADTQHAFYKVYHAGGLQQVEVSQAGNWCQWILLGTYSFNAGAGGYVRLGDYTGGEDPQRSVIADAVQFVWVSAP